MALKRNGLSKSIPTVNGCSPNTGPTSPGMAISVPSIGQPLNPSTCCAGGSLARTSALPEKAPDSPVNAAASGSNTPKRSKSSSRATSSSKMSPPFALADWIKCSGRSLRSGMMRNGIVYPRVPLVPLTGGIGSGLWRTPDASIVSGGAANAEDRKRQGHAIGLHDQVNTPSMWPTPTARDHFPPHTAEYIAAKKAQGHGMSNLNDRVGGSLNPTWVEWLMGYPQNWTSLED